MDIKNIGEKNNEKIKKMLASKIYFLYFVMNIKKTFNMV